MAQQIGETIPLIIEDDFKQVEAIINFNQKRDGIYYIVIAYKRHSLKSYLKPAQRLLLSDDSQNKHVLKRHIKAYSQKPPALQGTIVFEIDNQKGGITNYNINLPDVPFDEAAVARQIGEDTSDAAVKSNAPSGSYIYT